MEHSRARTSSRKRKQVYYVSRIGSRIQNHVQDSMYPKRMWLTSVWLVQDRAFEEKRRVNENTR